VLSGCFSQQPGADGYGVFIGLPPGNADKLAGYDIVAIDAAYFSVSQVGELLGNGQVVYSYLNIGSVEDFRDYYARFEGITVGDYENWPGERWVDVTEQAWQEFVCKTLAGQLAEKGITGFFVDNIDIYYICHTEDTYQGILSILSNLSAYGLDIVVNGGDAFVSEAAARGDLATSGISGVNQECVFTSIDFETKSFRRQSEEDTVYFKDYLSLCKATGLAVFLTEYANRPEPKLRNEIAAFCAENGYACYISPTLELDGG
jgi:hypothetical protein